MSTLQLILCYSSPGGRYLKSLGQEAVLKSVVHMKGKSAHGLVHDGPLISFTVAAWEVKLFLAPKASAQQQVGAGNIGQRNWAAGIVSV